MIYDCCFHVPDRAFVVALPHPWPWSNAERESPFCVVVTDELPVRANDYTVDLIVDGDVVSVMASEIDAALVAGE